MKAKGKLNKIRDFFADTKLGNVLFVATLLAYFIGILFLFDNQKEESNQEPKQELSTEQIANAIKQVESEEGPRISADPTEEEVYNNEFVKHIRNGLNRYLDGTNTGVEEFAIEKSTDTGETCGLNAFDKSYYKSKFIVIGASDADYGGLQASIFFVNKPDKVFWAWVYKLGDGDYVLRGFCEKEITAEQKADFNEFVKGMIKDSKYSL